MCGLIKQINYIFFGLVVYNLFMKQASLFCLVCHDDISQTTMFHATLLISSESFQWVGVHQLGLRLFGVLVWKLLIIQPIFQWKLNIKKMYWNLGTFLALESSWWARFNRIYFTNFRAMVWKLLIIEPFFKWKLNKTETENCIKNLGSFLVVLESPRVNQI